ncbi:MAG: dihydropteroate synthase [Verrucomicrobiaceae bacterium]|nr:dihydropteroate synthase [Verrucomicrobiaceae bacterium]
MGIVNINDDSFCGDGSLDPQQAIMLAGQQLREGAEIIDVGAESARTNRGPISVEEEVARLRPFIEAFPEIANAAGMPEAMLSVNTWRAEVVKQVLPLGVDLLNDMGALPEASNAGYCAEHGTALLIMHSVGQPKQPHRGEHYPDVVREVEEFFTRKLQLAENAGLERDRIVLDPGIDFAKDRDDNLQLLRELNRLTALQRPILLPVSRKTVIGEVLDLENPLDRDPGTIACAVTGIMRGAAILRVHNVAATISAVKVIDPITSNRN